MAPVVLELEKTQKIKSWVCVTGQHRHMLDQVLTWFNIRPDIDLNIMKSNQSLTQITSSVLTGVEKAIKKIKPDLLLVQGDTTTAFAASLAAFYQKIPVAHIEAGLRTGNIMAPWPEEMNRRQISLISDLHFAPTASSRENLLKEGIPSRKIYVTGNTVIDALLRTTRRLNRDRSLKKKLDRKFGLLDSSRKLILVTGHRRENFGRGFENICNAVRRLAERADVQVLYPVHLNPNVQKPVKRILGRSQRVFLTEPQDYLPFVYLMNRAHIILTDSGGIQEEAPSLGKPVLVMRDETERPEAVKAGTVLLVGTDEEKIIEKTEALLDQTDFYRKMSKSHNPYGDGKSAKKIVQILLREFAAKTKRTN